MHGRAVRQDESREPSVRIDRVHARRVDAQQVCVASAYIFVAPENLGSLSGVMKEFFDRTYYGVLDRVAGRPYAVIIAAGSDGQGAARQVERIATGWRLKAVAQPMIVITQAQTPEAILAPKRLSRQDLAQAGELGAALAQGLALGIY
jgi:NAD(P)H-dependent FMN reductase